MRVFLSSTYIDLAKHRKAAAEALERLGQEVGRMEVFGARPQKPEAACLDEIDKSDLFVGIYAHRYGFVPEGESLSITEAEFRHAQKHAKPSFCFLVADDYPWPPEMIEGEPGRSKLQALKNTVSTSVVRESFTTPHDLAFKVAASLGRFLAQQTASPRLPGSLPPICNLKLHRNPYFSGRDKALETIRDTFVSETETVPIQVIAGLGGVGKTQMALEYVYRHVCDYDLVWWLPANDYPSLVAEYGKMALALDLPEKSVSSYSEMARSVCRWLQQNGDWLLVFDDAAGWSQIRSLVPVGASGHTIVTSRNQVWSDVPAPIHADRWDRSESVAFLSRRIDPTNTKIANEVAEVLGDLPLALEHAAAYVLSKSVSLTEYLDLFTKEQFDLFGRIQPPEDYGKTILTTWNLSFEAAGRSSVEAAVILYFSAFLSPDEIPKTLFTVSPVDVEPLIQSLAFHDAVETLRHYSLIESTDTSISVHPLVQAVVRESLRDEGITWAQKCILRLLTAFPQGDVPDQWDECAALYPHVVAAANHAESMKCDLEQVGHLLHNAAIYLNSRGLLTEVRILADRVVKLAQKVFGIDHPNTAAALNNRGVILSEMGDFSAAETDYGEARRILEARFGPENPDVAQLSDNQALNLLKQGRHAEALEKCLTALETDKASFGGDHEAVARDLMTRGGILEQLGNLPASLQDHLRAYEIYSKRLGKESTNAVTALSNLGKIQERIGDLLEARRNQEMALSVGERLLGAGHPHVATYLSNLGNVLEKMKEPEKAIPLYERALSIEEDAYGPHHSNVATILVNLAHALRDVGDIQGAKDRLKRAIGILTEFYGPDHPEVALVTSNLESLENLLRKFSQRQRELYTCSDWDVTLR